MTNITQHRMDKLKGSLASASLGKGLHHHNLTLFPITGDPAKRPPYVLLGPAIAAGTVRVEEMGQGGSVPELVVHNTGDVAVLITEGEMLVGAKQNRVVNVTTIVEPLSHVVIPVACVEQGRWSAVSNHFQSSSRHAPAKLRAKKLRSVQRSRAQGGASRSDQGMVWDEVQGYLASASASSPTASILEAYDKQGDRLAELRHSFEMPARTRGLIVGRGDELLGMDLFDAPVTFQAMFEKLSDGYLLEASRDPRKARRTLKRQARAFLDEVAAGLACARDDGRKMELEVAGARITGSGIVYEGVLCHLSAFPASDPVWH